MDLAEFVDWHQAGLWRYLRYRGADATEAEEVSVLALFVEVLL